MLNGKFVRMRERAQGRTIPPIRTTISAAEKELSAEERQLFENTSKQMGAPKIGPPFDRLPAEIQAMRLWGLAQPHYLSADSYPYMSEEFAEIYVARQKQEYPLGDIPLAVLLKKPGYDSEESRQQKIEFTKLSRNSKLNVAENSGHHIHLDEPAVVTNAIQQVIEAVQRRAKLLP